MDIDLSKEFNTIFKEYTEEVIEIINEEGEKAAKEGLKELKANSPKRTGKYARSWRLQRDKSPIGINEYTLYNKNHYQLTHLLERPHLTRDGRTYSKAQPHIKPVEEKISKQFLDSVIRRLKA